jgi:hypothetical protein
MYIFQIKKYFLNLFSSRDPRISGGDMLEPSRGTVDSGIRFGYKLFSKKTYPHKKGTPFWSSPKHTP